MLIDTKLSQNEWTDFRDLDGDGIPELIVNSWNDNNPMVCYKLAKNEYGSAGSTTCNSAKGKTVSTSCTFYDVTQGDMDVNCKGYNCYDATSKLNGVLSFKSTAYNPAYGTTVGWDYATGIGSVNANNLVNNWSTVTK